VGDKLYFSFHENPTTGYKIIVDNTTINGVFNYTERSYAPKLPTETIVGQA
jgi:hypothetical protein